MKQKAKKKSAKRKREQSCSICLGRGRYDESKNHSDQHCAYPGGPYEGKYKVAKKQRQKEQEKITEVVSKHRDSLTSAQILDALAKVRERRVTELGEVLPDGPNDIVLRMQWIHDKFEASCMKAHQLIEQAERRQSKDRKTIEKLQLRIQKLEDLNRTHWKGSTKGWCREWNPERKDYVWYRKTK